MFLLWPINDVFLIVTEIRVSTFNNWGKL